MLWRIHYSQLKDKPPRRNMSETSFPLMVPNVACWSTSARLAELWTLRLRLRLCVKKKKKSYYFILFSISSSSCKVTFWLFLLLFELLQTITPVHLISSNAAAIAAYPNDGFVMEQMTVVTMRMRPTSHAQVCIESVLDAVWLWLQVDNFLNIENNIL